MIFSSRRVSRLSNIVPVVWIFLLSPSFVLFSFLLSLSVYHSSNNNKIDNNVNCKFTSRHCHSNGANNGATAHRPRMNNEWRFWPRCFRKKSGGGRLLERARGCFYWRWIDTVMTVPEDDGGERVICIRILFFCRNGALSPIRSHYIPHIGISSVKKLIKRSVLQHDNMTFPYSFQRCSK